MWVFVSNPSLCRWPIQSLLQTWDAQCLLCIHDACSQLPRTLIHRDLAPSCTDNQMSIKASEWAVFWAHGEAYVSVWVCVWARDKVHVSRLSMCRGFPKCPMDDSSHRSQISLYSLHFAKLNIQPHTDAAGVSRHSVFSTSSVFYSAMELSHLSNPRGAEKTRQSVWRKQSTVCVLLIKKPPS